MNLVIPPSIQVGANMLRIRRNEKAMKIADLRGQMDLPHGIIRLSFEFDGESRTKTQLFESFIHELIHLIDHLYMRARGEADRSSS